jgi:pimeloyl-ACP methyl ester carboxylesterase
MKSLVRVAIVFIACCFAVVVAGQTNPVIQPSQWDMPGTPVIDDALLSRNFLQPFNPADARFAPAAVLQGMVLPLQFARDVGYGLYLDEPFVANKPMIVLVHGMNDSPLRFQPLLKKLHRERYQVARFYYPTAMKIAANGEVLARMLGRVLQRAPEMRFVIVAHSLGGLVSRSAIEYLQTQNKATAVTDFFSIASPWGGHELAKLAVSRSPIIMPVWRDLADDGEFLQQMYARPLPKNLRFHLLYASGGGLKAFGEANDGVLTVRCQLDERARRAAHQVIEINAAHIPALQHANTVNSINAALLAVALVDE